MYPAQFTKSEVTNKQLIWWHRFERIFVGVATYPEPHEWRYDEYIAWKTQFSQHQATLERERTWWRGVPELQKFVPKDANGTAQAGPHSGH